MTVLTTAPAPAPPAPAGRPAPRGEPAYLPDGGHDLPKLDRRQLRIEQQRTLDTPRRQYSVAARGLFLVMDLLYGRKRTLSKFRVLEIVARVPYQTWQTVTYKQISKQHRNPHAIR